MTHEQLHKGKELAERIRAKKQELYALESSKLIGLQTRTFNKEKSVYEDYTYTDFPNQKTKGLMLQHLKDQIKILESNFEKLGTVDESSEKKYITDASKPQTFHEELNGLCEYINYAIKKEQEISDAQKWWEIANNESKI